MRRNIENSYESSKKFNKKIINKIFVLCYVLPEKKKLKNRKTMNNFDTK